MVELVGSLGGIGTALVARAVVAAVHVWVVVVLVVVAAAEW